MPSLDDYWMKMTGSVCPELRVLNQKWKKKRATLWPKEPTSSLGGLTALSSKGLERDAGPVSHTRGKGNRCPENQKHTQNLSPEPIRYHHRDRDQNMWFQRYGSVFKGHLGSPLSQPPWCCPILHMSNLRARGCESESRSVMSDSLQPCGLYSPWSSPGQDTGVGSHSLLQEIFPTQVLNPGLPHCRWTLYQLSHKHPINCCAVKVTQSCPLCVTPWTIAHQALLSMEFSRPEYWRG